MHAADAASGLMKILAIGYRSLRKIRDLKLRLW